MDTILTGHPKVDAIAQIRLEGDITPKSWYHHICYQTKQGEQKADRLAIDILSDIVYWYRPYQKRDELTGEAIGWCKRFAEDLLRRSSDAFAETLNASARCIRESIKLLEGMGLITVVLRPVRTAYGVIPNVMHIDINPEAIASISYRVKGQKPETLEKSLLTKWVTSNDETSNNHLRNGKQSPTVSQPTDDEIDNSSIYRDFLKDFSHTSLQQEGGEVRAPSHSPEPEKKQVSDSLSSSLEEKAEVIPRTEDISETKDSAAPCDNKNFLPHKHSIFPRNIDGSERLPWEVAESPKKFEGGFEAHMMRSLQEFPSYKGLMPGEFLTKVRKHISVGKHNPQRKDELLIEWEAYQASLTPTVPTIQHQAAPDTVHQPRKPIKLAGRR